MSSSSKRRVRSGSSRRWLRSSSNNLSFPEELLEEILSRLPVKSLIRFRCVKKSWSANFQQPSFIAKQFRNRCDQANPSLLLESNLFPGYGLSLHPYPDNDDVERFRIVDFRNDMGITELQHINMIGCVNGIICLGGCFNGGLDGFVLWNPAIRKRKFVPYHSPPGAAHLFPSHHFRTFYAFGYNQYSNDFKVVRIVTCNEKSRSIQNATFTDYYNFSHVYSLKADSWTQVIDPDIHHSNIRLITRCYAIYFNGFHHWLGFLDNRDRNKLEQNCDCEIILSFNMNNNAFQIMRLPDEVFRKLRYPELDNVSRMNKIFSVFNDCLAFIVYKDEDTMTEKYFDIWVMREYGIEDSWTKQLVVGPLLGIEMPLQFAKSGELLLVRDDDAIVLYNIGSKEIRNLQLTKFPDSFIPVQAMVYEESLFSFTDTMVCGACKIMKKRCKDNCCFAEFFGPQDTEKLQKLKIHYSFKLMREMLSDANTTKEDKERLLQEWNACVDAKGKEKQAGSLNELDTMVCGACKIMIKRCKDNCCFLEFFGPQDIEKFQKLRIYYLFELMRDMLSDANNTNKDKQRLLQELNACVDAKGKEKQAGSSSSKNEKKELQASKCQAASSNELGKFTQTWSGSVPLDTMVCGACKIMKKRCKDNCCFAKFFGPQDTEKLQKLKIHYSFKLMREMLSDANTTKEDKEQLLQEWNACVDAKGKEKQAGSSSSKNEKKELQASKCQAASSNELGKFTQTWSGSVPLDTMVCGACKIMKKRCKDNCCFAEFFGPQDTEKLQKLKIHYSFKLMREMLSDANTTKDDKERLLQEWNACVDAKGKEKQAGSSSSKNEKKELQASKCQAASSNELGKFTQTWSGSVPLDTMVCGACKIMKKRCKDNCCFAEFFGPQDTEKFQKLKIHYSFELMREMLSDANTTKEDKERLLQEWNACIDAKGKEKQAGSSSSKNEKKELQASKCQAALSNELGKFTQTWSGFVPLDTMVCGACKIMKKRCKDNCCFAEFFGPQDTEKFQKLKIHYSFELMREMLSDANTTKEDKERLLQEWNACVDAKGKEKQAGSSSLKNKMKELQASKCQAASSNETEVKSKLEKLGREIDEEAVAQIMLDFKNEGDRQ